MFGLDFRPAAWEISVNLGEVTSTKRTSAADITRAVIDSFGGAPDPRLAEVMTALVRHLHAFAVEVALSMTIETPAAVSR